MSMSFQVKTTATTLGGHSMDLLTPEPQGVFLIRNPATLLHLWVYATDGSFRPDSPGFSWGRFFLAPDVVVILGFGLST
jgi:hypothetical protein